MKKIEAQTLELAYMNAAKEFTCSITELDISIIQNSSSGFLGMFKKSAIIEVERKSVNRKNKNQRNRKEKINTPRNAKQEIKEQKTKEQKTKRQENAREEKPRGRKQKIEPKREQKPNKTKPKREEKVTKKEPRPVVKRELKKQTPKVDIEKAIDEIREDVNRLFKQSCFEMDDIKVAKYDENTILVEFGGADAALLIGKEGYRYKALSYFLYNWINIKYGANIRLEIAEFLRNQEEMISKYLVPVIERVTNNGRGQTKVLDGVLIKIALEKLRIEFPEKYVGIKSARSGGRFIVINDFNRKTK